METAAVVTLFLAVVVVVCAVIDSLREDSAGYESKDPPAATRSETGRPREVLLWVGDGMAPAGPDLIGRPVDIGGRTGRVVEVSALTVTVEWDS